MSDKMLPSSLFLHTLPVEFIYRILDNLDDFTILTSLRNVFTRLNIVMDTYNSSELSFLSSKTQENLNRVLNLVLKLYEIDFSFIFSVTLNSKKRHPRFSHHRNYIYPSGFNTYRCHAIYNRTSCAFDVVRKISNAEFDIPKNDKLAF